MHNYLRMFIKSLSVIMFWTFGVACLQHGPIARRHCWAPQRCFRPITGVGSHEQPGQPQGFPSSCCAWQAINILACPVRAHCLHPLKSGGCCSAVKQVHLHSLRTFSDAVCILNKRGKETIEYYKKNFKIAAHIAS